MAHQAAPLRGKLFNQLVDWLALAERQLKRVVGYGRPTGPLALLVYYEQLLVKH